MFRVPRVVPCVVRAGLCCANYYYYYMRVLYQRLRWVGMSPAQADRAGGAQGIR